MEAAIFYLRKMIYSKWEKGANYILMIEFWFMIISEFEEGISEHGLFEKNKTKESNLILTIWGCYCIICI